MSNCGQRENFIGLSVEAAAFGSPGVDMFDCVVPRATQEGFCQALVREVEGGKEEVLVWVL